jgi:outer membrane protein
MKKKSDWPIATILALLMLCVFCGTNFAGVQAPGQSKTKGFGLDGGYVLPADGNLGSVPAFGLNFFYSLSNHLRIELKGSFIPVKAESNPEGLSAGTLKVIPLQLSLQYRFNINPRLRPYVTAGVGYYLTSFSIENIDVWRNLGFEITEDTDNVWGFHGGLGLDYFLKPHVALNFDARYIIANLAGNFTITEELSGISHNGEFTGDLNHLLVGVGIKFLF